MIAWRSEPAPLLAVLLTTKGALARGAVGAAATRMAPVRRIAVNFMGPPRVVGFGRDYIERRGGRVRDVLAAGEDVTIDADSTADADSSSRYVTRREGCGSLQLSRRYSASPAAGFLSKRCWMASRAR